MISGVPLNSLVRGGQTCPLVFALVNRRDSSYKRGIACQQSYAKIGDWELRTSLLLLVETCQDVNKHKEDRQIIIYTSHQFSRRIPDQLSPFNTKNPWLVYLFYARWMIKITHNLRLSK